MKELEDKGVRITAMEDDFPLFFAFHFGWDFTDFQIDWMESMQSEKNTMITAFRASRKTTMVRGYVVWCICYKVHSSIIWQSYEDTLSAESVREIAKMLCKKSIVEDYGTLFPFDTRQTDLAKRSLSNFETTNGVKVASKSMGQTLRGANTYDMAEEISARPTLLVLDDIDVVKSVNNIDIINSNEAKITGETIPALDPLNRKVIFLGNVINEDGIVPRFHKRYKGNSQRDCFWQPLFDDKGNNVWSEVFTPKVLESIQGDGKTSYNQNYLLIPSQAGNGVFIRQYFDYFLLSHFEDPSSFLKKNEMRLGMFIDPAFSTDAKSDDACIITLGEHIISKQYYLFDGYADTSAPSKTIAAAVVMYNRAIADGFTISFVSVESAKINKSQTKFISDLKAELVRQQINVPVYHYTSYVKKEDRIKFNLEGIMSQNGLKFNRSMPDKSFIGKVETQFLEFPNGDHDDTIDCISQGVEQFRKKQEPTKEPVEQTKYHPVTRERMHKAVRSLEDRRNRILGRSL